MDRPWFWGLPDAEFQEPFMKCYICPALAMVAAFAAAPLTAQTEPTYTLTYDAADGSLTIDTFGDPLYNYIIDGTGVFANNDGFLESNHRLIPDAPGPENNSFTSSDDELSQSDFNGWFGLGPQDLGNVLPAGLTEGEFNALIDPAETKYVRALGTLGNPDFFYNFEIVYNVPEPGSIVLLGLGAALLAQRRRRDR